MFQALVERYSGFGGQTKGFFLVSGSFETYAQAIDAGQAKIDEIVNQYPLIGFNVIILENGESVD